MLMIFYRYALENVNAKALYTILEERNSCRTGKLQDPEGVQQVSLGQQPTPYTQAGGASF
jgi:hypothetical protein